jgi:hypothetical protein
MNEVASYGHSGRSVLAFPTDAQLAHHLPRFC